MKKHISNIKTALLMFIFSSIEVSAQALGGKAAAGLNSAASELKGTVNTIITIAMIVVGLGFIVGLIIIGYKIVKGDNEAASKAAGFVGALMFVLIGLYVVQTMFLT